MEDRRQSLLRFSFNHPGHTVRDWRCGLPLGQRVEAFAVDIWKDSEWRESCARYKHRQLQTLARY